MAVMKMMNAINRATLEAMDQDESVICFGLGADDPKRIFGTTDGLIERFGSERVFDTPTSENGMTGIAIGAAINGLKPVVTHQRLDFFLLAMDQLVNNAAKWQYMFGGQDSVPITIRLIVGRGWGQGPTHSQNLQNWFNHIPGLKVVCPSNAADARGLLLESIFDPDPVVFLEHRWLHQSESEVPEEPHRVPLGKGSRIREGSDLTIIGFSYMIPEAIRAAEFLQEQMGVSADLIDLRTLNPMDWDLVHQSVRQTGRAIVLDTAQKSFSMSGEIASRITENNWDELKAPVKRIGLPDHPTPTSHALTPHFYRSAIDIVETAQEIMNVREKLDIQSLRRDPPLDVPGAWFKGPF